MERAFQAEKEQVKVSEAPRGWPVQGQLVSKVGRTQGHLREVNRGHDKELGVYPKIKGKPVKDFRHKWDVIPLTHFSKMFQAVLLRTDHKGAGGEVGKPLEGRGGHPGK